MDTPLNIKVRAVWGKLTVRINHCTRATCSISTQQSVLCWGVLFPVGEQCLSADPPWTCYRLLFGGYADSQVIVTLKLYVLDSSQAHIQCTSLWQVS